MPPALPTQHDHDPAATTPMPKVEAMPQLPERTLAWLAERPVALAVIESVWTRSPSWKRQVTLRVCLPPCDLCSSITRRLGQATAAPAVG